MIYAYRMNMKVYYIIKTLKGRQDLVAQIVRICMLIMYMLFGACVGLGVWAAVGYCLHYGDTTFVPSCKHGLIWQSKG